MAELAGISAKFGLHKVSDEEPMADVLTVVQEVRRGKGRKKSGAF